MVRGHDSEEINHPVQVSDNQDQHLILDESPIDPCEQTQVVNEICEPEEMKGVCGGGEGALK